MTGDFQLVPDADFDPAIAAAAGWTRSLTLRLADGTLYRPLFSLADRLAHDAAEALQENTCHVILATVVVPDFEMASLQDAARHLVEWGYLDHMKPAFA